MRYLQSCVAISFFERILRINVFMTNLSYDESERCWTASYPFLRDSSVLRDNFDTAFRALKRRETKFMKDESLKICIMIK